jgi:hypothetical protein
MGNGVRRGALRPVVTAVAATVALACLLAAAAAAASSPVTALGLTALGPSGVNALGVGMAAGRVQDVAQDPFDANHLLALSDAALWESTDGTRTWHHLTGLERFGQWSFESGALAFDPAQRGVVLIASPADRRATTGRGIYRSSDGGATWAPATAPGAGTYQPACPFTTAGTFGSTTGLAFFGHTVYAAGGCTLGRSTDDGATWRWDAPLSAGVDGYSSVAVDSAGNAFTCGSGGILEATTAHPDRWGPVLEFDPSPFATHPWTDGEPRPDLGVDSSTCRIASAPGQPEHVFFSATWQNDTRTVPSGESKYFSDVFEAYNDPTTGWQWQDLLGPGHNNGRDVVVATRPSPKGGIDLYWDSNDNDFTLNCAESGGFDCRQGATNDETQPDPPWVALPEGPGGDGTLHADTSKFLFASSAPHCLLAIAGDGGVMRPNDCDGLERGWVYADAGISAAEPYDLALTSIPAVGTDAYISTQDNDYYTLLATNPGWFNGTGGDGFGIESTVFSTRGMLDRVRLYWNDDDTQYIAGRGAAAPPPSVNTATPFAAPWHGIDAYGGPQLAQLPTGQLALAVTKPRAPAPSPDVPPPSDYPLVGVFLTRDGTTWSPFMIVSGPAVPTAGPTIYGAGTSTNPVLFLNASGFLDRVHVATSSFDAVLPDDTIGPFAAGDALHLLTFACPTFGSCSDGHALASDDGGTTWRDLDVLTRLVQDDGFGNAYALDGGGPTDSEISAVAVDPSNPRVLTVGTRDTGVFESGDGGASWERISFVAPSINNMRFDVPGNLYFTSYGRGLFMTTPRPDTLTLAPVSTAPTLQTWTATALDFDGRPLTGRLVKFTLLSHDGTSTAVGTATTGRDGSARLTFRVALPSNAYRLVAHWSGELNTELETEAVTKAGK